MRTGPEGQKRPADVISAAVKAMRIDTGQEEETDPTKGRTLPPSLRGSSAARRAEKREPPLFPPERRREIAEKAATSRWTKRDR